MEKVLEFHAFLLLLGAKTVTELTHTFPFCFPRFCSE